MCMAHDLCQGNQLVRCRIEAFQQNSQIFRKCLLLYNFSTVSYLEQTFNKLFINAFFNTESFTFIQRKIKYEPNADV